MRFVRRVAGKPVEWVRLMVKAPLAVMLMLPLMGWLFVMFALIANIFDPRMSSEVNLGLGVVGIILGLIAFPAAAAASEEADRAVSRR